MLKIYPTPNNENGTDFKFHGRLLSDIMKPFNEGDFVELPSLGDPEF